MVQTNRHRLLSRIRRRGFITAREAVNAGFHGQELTRLVEEGVLLRVARGQYALDDRSVTEHHGLSVAARAVPQGVICLLSALSFHGIGTQLPAEVWIAVERGARMPALAHPPLRVVRFGGAAFIEGVERHRIEGALVPVYSVAKTLADLFKYRNKVGVEVAIEALREAWRERKFSMDALDHAARVCRVERVMRPFVEAIVA